jgi:hypothetical protein
MRVALACLATLAVAVAGAAAATTHPGLDRSYGENGVVHVVPPEAPDAPATAGVQSFGPAPDGSAYVIASGYICAKGANCGYEYFLGRYAAGGGQDAGFGGAPGGFVPLPSAGRYSVIADEGAALVVGFSAKGIALRRFTAAGAPDQGFGTAGTAAIACGCGGEAHLHAFVEPDGKILVEVDQAVGFVFEDGTRVRLTRLLPNGRLDRSFGKSGTASFAIHGPGAPTSVATTAGDATLIGGSGFAILEPCCGRRHIYLRRVSSDGRLDRRFERNASRSLKRIEIRGKFPTLTAVVAEDDGTISVLGYGNETGGGFEMRLRADGRLAPGFGRGGVRHLPFTVSGAVGGIDGAIFAVGSRGRNPYEGDRRAFRILRGGGLDPGYRRGHGIAVPISGTRMAITALGDGRAMVTDNGNSYCREACVPDPTMVRYLE